MPISYESGFTNLNFTKFLNPSLNIKDISIYDNFGVNNMSDIHDEADENIRETLRQEELKKVERRKRDAYDWLDEEPDGDNVVIRFKKLYEPSFGNSITEPTWYTYAGIKAGGSWWITGKNHQKPYTWNELRLFMVSGEHPVDKYELMTPMGARLEDN